MKKVNLQLPETEARALYRHIHRYSGGQDLFCEAYCQLQSFYFQTMTIEEITELLGSDE